LKNKSKKGGYGTNFRRGGGVCGKTRLKKGVAFLKKTWL